ncbi:unnamed protein product [Cylicocyclus nassatus]|uniref:CWH43-like N-terminal domain-containing protein n=1 Tax=Cylicocyclus nassatus TaxID=53992 RepID=A0AA36H1I5_CYLNA|nr:unnamed protein product [Cylicocyclus nassatus]
MNIRFHLFDGSPPKLIVTGESLKNKGKIDFHLFRLLMILRKPWLVPIIAVVCALIAMLSGYIIGVAVDHYPPLLPFISDGGGRVPEASVFGQFLNTAAFLYIFTIYLIYLETVEYYGHCMKWKRTRWWKVSISLLFLGIACAYGMTIVGNFRYTEIKTVHMIGAMLTFVGMVIYGWGQVITGYILQPSMAPKLLRHFRLLIIILTTCCLILHLLAEVSPVFIPPGAGKYPGGNEINRTSDSPFFRTFIIATSGEWAMVLLMQLFVLTYVNELRYAEYYSSRITFLNTAEQ